MVRTLAILCCFLPSPQPSEKRRLQTPFWSLILLLSLSGCGELLSERLANVREDSIAPEITFTSPEVRSIYYSKIEVQAKVSDSSRKTNDEKGLLRSISFDVNGGLGNRNTKGGIKFDSLGRYVQDDSAGNAKLLFVNGLLSFSFDVADLGSLPLILEIKVKATDFVGQETNNTISLIRSGGPHIQINTPDNSVSALLANSTVNIKGRLGNSVLNSTERDELSSLNLEILGLNSPILANLNLTEGKVTDGKIQQIEPITNGILEYDTTTGDYRFDFVLFDDLVRGRNIFTIKIVAQDKTRIRTTATKSIIILNNLKPNLIFSQPQSSNKWYYSSTGKKFYHAQAGLADEITFNGAVRVYEPTLLPDRIALVVKSGSNPKQERVNLLDQDEATLNEDQTTYSIRDYKIPISTFLEWANIAIPPQTQYADVLLILDVTKTDDREVSNNREWDIVKDHSGPGISSFSFALLDSSGQQVNSRAYAIPGDQIQTSFMLNDPGSGTRLDSLNGQFHGTNLANDDFTITANGDSTIILPVTAALVGKAVLKLSLNVQDYLSNPTSIQQTVNLAVQQL